MAMERDYNILRDSLIYPRF